MSSLTPPPHAQHAMAADGECFRWVARPGVVVEVAIGVLSRSMADSLAPFYEPIFTPGTRFRIFDDFERLTHYTRAGREVSTVFALEHLDHVEEIHFLLSSKLIALGVSAFKQAIGDARVCVYTDRPSFLRSFEAAMRAPPDDADSWGSVQRG